MSEQIDNIIYDLFNGEAIAEDEQELIKSSLKLTELVSDRIPLLEALLLHLKFQGNMATDEDIINQRKIELLKSLLEDANK